MRFVFLPLHSHSVYTFFLGMTVFPLSDSVIAKDLDVLPFFDLCSTIMIQVAELHKTQEILGMRMPHVNGSSINPSVVSFCLNDAAWILRTLSQQFPNVHRNVAIVAIRGHLWPFWHYFRSELFIPPLCIKVHPHSPICMLWNHNM